MKKELRSQFSTRQYMLSKDFELYYYSDKDLTKVGNHTHNYWEFYFFLEGDVDMFIREQPYPLNHGDIVVVPPGISHHAYIHHTEIPYRRFVFWVSKEYADYLKNLSADYIYLMQKAKEEQTYVYHFDEYSFNALQSKVFSLLEEIHSKRFGRSSKIRIYTADLILSLSRQVYENSHLSENTEETLYDRVAAYIESHIDEDLSLDSIAEHFFVSKYHISHIFKDNIGFSVHQYILKKRLFMSKDFIVNGMKAAEAAQAVGFSDYSVFFRAFIKEYGVSPTAYRNQIKKHLSEASKK